MPRIIICHSSVAKQLQQISKDDKAVGLLIGYSSDDILTVSACVRCVSNNVLAELEDIDTYLPGGVFIVGYFHHKSKDLLKKLSTQFSQLLILTLPDNLTNILSEDNFNFWTADDGKSSVTVNITDECVVNTSVIARNTCCIDVTIDIGDSEESWKKSLNKEIDRQYKIIKSGCIMYKLQQSNVLIGGNQSCGITKDSKCVDLYDLIEEDGGIFKRTRKKKDKHLETLQFTTFLKRSGTPPDEDIPPCAPVIYHNIANTKSVDITLNIDTISTVTTDTTVSKLAVAVSTSVCRQLKAMTNCMMQHSKMFGLDDTNRFIENREKCLSQLNIVLAILTDANHIADTECDEIINQFKQFRETILNSEASSDFSSFTVSDNLNRLDTFWYNQKRGCNGINI
ncbi:unnamed protein product [Mytilus edulis]|uniref:UFSP2 second domain-containing protein n=1 Tax=Mytilus edulis TaxID=6550 RepID=A0A8S3UER3_MYTED|nr:unnamed protein product [Mytilus edulis]